MYIYIYIYLFIYLDEDIHIIAVPCGAPWGGPWDPWGEFPWDPRAMGLGGPWASGAQMCLGGPWLGLVRSGETISRQN